MDETTNLTGPIDALWLFSYELYGTDQGDPAEAYQHFIRVGDREGRTASLFFDPAMYRAQLAPDPARAAADEGACRHFLRHRDGNEAEPRTSVYFDPQWYIGRYPSVSAAIGDGDFTCALHHYLTNDTPTEFDPLPQFSERFYLARYPDVARAVAGGISRSGYLHFLQHGVFELRSPSPEVDLRRYVDSDATVREDLDYGRARDAFAHYLSSGPAPKPGVRVPAAMPPISAEIEAHFRLRADIAASATARRSLDFTFAGDPVLSVVLVARNHFTATLMTLSALRMTCAAAIELLLIDAGSEDETRYIDRFVTGATLLRLDGNLDRLRARNAALACASADAVLLLDPGIELCADAVTATLDRLASDPSIGVIGGKLIRPNGRLLLAGGMVFRDGSSAGYLRGQRSTAPEADFVRDVDFCSGRALLVRRKLLEQLNGFDEQFSAGGEDIDLCLRVQQAGYRVAYDPAMTAWLHDDALPELDDAAPLLRVRHGAYLQVRPEPGTRHDLARCAGPERKRVLFLDDTVPIRNIGSGFVRSNDLIIVMASMGFMVTMFPLMTPAFSPSMIAADLPDDVEVMRDDSAATLERFLEDRSGFYDVIWIARTHNLNRVQAALSNAPRCPPLVLDTEAIASLRDAARARIQGHDFDLNAALTAEFRNAAVCRHVVAVSAQEAAVLRDLGLAEVTEIGHVREPRLTERRFTDRSGMLFFGAIHEVGSPNYDALCWFIDEVLPLVERELGWQTRLTIAGYLAPGVKLEGYRNHPRVTLHGVIADAAPLYDSHRVFVAPTRFAAGVPYKVHEAASFGLPVIATELLRSQLGWENETELLAAEMTDPADFAHNVVRLYRDQALWQRLRGGAAARITAENGRGRYVQALRSILGSPLRSPDVPSAAGREPAP